jgi:diaminopropionate ammonia-lyase
VSDTRRPGGEVHVRPGWYARPEARLWTSPAASPDPVAFHRSLPGYAPTALRNLPDLAAELGVGRALVKDESTRLGLGAFKVLGASWAVAQVVASRSGGSVGGLGLDEARAMAATLPGLRLVTATDGNHGRAVARVAKWLGVPALVVVPDLMRAPAVRAIESEGAAVVSVAGSYDQAVAEAAAISERHPGDALVQDTAWPGYQQVPEWIVAGYATLFREVEEQLSRLGVEQVGLVAVPVGVGSFAQAAVVHYRSTGSLPRPAVLSVEPDSAACVLASLSAGAPLSVVTADTVMAGLNCGTPSAAAWPVMRDGLDAAVAVDDQAAEQAVADLARLGVSSGPSGAAALAGARAALCGPGSQERRAELAVDATTVVLLLSTEGAPAAGDVDLEGPT